MNSYVSEVISNFALHYGLSGVLNEIATAIIFAVLVLILISAFDYMYGWFERKVMAKAQLRHGPNVVGKYGILQNLADIVKLLAKENIVPKNANKYLFLFSVPLMLALLIFIEEMLPLSPNFYGVDLSIGLLVVFVLISFTPLILFIAGWASGNKFGSISADRSVMMLISYELPMFLVMASVAVAAGSYNLMQIVNAQSSLPFALLLPVGFMVFFIVMLAEFERPPFDIREADSELIAGWLTDASSPFYSIALFIDYTRVLLGSIIITLLFLGGWIGPFSFPFSGFAWLIAKVILVALFLIVIRVTMIRMRIDKLLRFGWTIMLPLAVVNLLWAFALVSGYLPALGI